MPTGLPFDSLIVPVRATNARLTPSGLSRYDCVPILLPAEPSATVWAALPHAARLRSVYQHQRCKPGEKRDPQGGCASGDYAHRAIPSRYRQSIRNAADRGSGDGKGDHVFAARFLNRFVPQEIPWLHLDLSAGSRAGGLGHIGTDIIVFGVRFTLEVLRRGWPGKAKTA